MAHLDERRRDRAQILLVTALLLGVLFVALALILNSAIFTENLASRGETTGGDNVVEYHSDLRRGTGAVMTYENWNASGGDSHGDVADRVEVGVNDIGSILTRRHAKSGGLSDVSMTGREDGSRVYQTDDSRNFTDGNAQNDWTVVEDVERTRGFRLGVSSADSACTLFSSCFNITISNSTHSWNMSVKDTLPGLKVEVNDVTGSTASCSTSSSTARIDLTAGTLDGTDCEALSSTGFPNGPYDVEYNNADQIHGNYSLVVDNRSVSATPPAHFSTGSGPSVSPALYTVTLSYRYETPDINVSSDMQVEPGERDE